METRKSQKFMSVLLALALMLAIVPAITPAAQARVNIDALEIKKNGDGTVTIRDCPEGASGELVIPETIDGCTVTAIGKNAFHNCKKITNVSIPETVVSIEDWAFFRCEGLVGISIPDSVTKLGKEVFEYCTSLQSIKFSSGIKKIPTNTCFGCSSLYDVKLPLGVEEIGIAAFMKCTALKSITIPSSVKIIDYEAFTGSGLESIHIPANVQSLGGYVFLDCTSLKTVKIEYGLKSLNQQDFSHTALESIVIPDSVTEVGAGSFQGCGNLKEAAIGGGIKELGTGMFYNCTSLEEVTIREGVTKIKRSFEGCSAIKTLYLPKSLLEIDEKSFDDSEAISDIYYGGSSYDWDGVAIADRNGALNGNTVTMHFMPFGDVTVSDYFFKSVTWASDNGYVKGTSSTAFSPHDTCTQGQILTFIYRIMGEPAVSGQNPFTKVPTDAYYYKPMFWAYQEGLITDLDIDPEAPCPRSDVVTYLWREAGKPAAAVTDRFTDVPASAAYAQAVAWAVNRGITNGTSDTTFSPDSTCTRGQIATFLYNTYEK